MSDETPAVWEISNARCDLRIMVDAHWVYLQVDAGKYERYSCRIEDYLREVGSAQERTHRDLVRDYGGLEVARAVEAAVKVRLARPEAIAARADQGFQR